MKSVFILICLQLCLFCCAFTQETKKQKFSDPIYANTIISVKQNEGKLKDLIAQISEQNKGIPAIDADLLSLQINIPPIKAENVRMGILLMALHKIYDEVSEIELEIKTDHQAVFIKGKKIEKPKVKIQVIYKDELIVSKIKRNNFIKTMIENKWLESFVEAIKQKQEISVLSFFDDANENQIYLYGTNENSKLLERLINRAEKKWAQQNNKPIIEWVDEIYKEDRIDILQVKIKDNQEAIKVYKLHKDNALTKIDTGESDQKEKLKEVEDLDKHIDDALKQIRLYTAEIEKLKK